MAQFLGSGGVIVPVVSALPASGSPGEMLALASGQIYIWADSAWTGIGASGVAVLNFGTAGATDTSLFISAPTISSSSVPLASILVAASSDHQADEHWVEDIQIFVGNVVAGSGFTIYGRTGGPYLLFGHFNVSWSWN